MRKLRENNYLFRLILLGFVKKKGKTKPSSIRSL